jgi:hypothetical protein
MTQNHLFWTRRSDRGAIDTRPHRRLLGNEDVAAVNERRIENFGTYTDLPDEQAIAGAADNEEINGAHGSNVTV